MDKLSPSRSDADGIQEIRSTRFEKKRIGELLVDEGFLTVKQLQESVVVQKERGGKIVEILVRLGHLDIDVFTKFLLSRSGVASIDLSRYDVPRAVLDLIPHAFAQKYGVFPVDKVGSLLTVGMVSPLDAKIKEEFEDITGLKVKSLLCHRDGMLKARQQYYIDTELNDSDDEESSTVSTDAHDRLTSALKLQDISTLIRRIETLPAFPKTVHKVREATEDLDVPLDEMADIVLLDPPVSARMLRLINSAEFGVATQVDNIRTAVSLLGLRETSMPFCPVR